MTKWCIDVKLVFNVYMKIWFLSKMIHSKYLRFKIWLIFVLKVTHYILHDPVDCAHACPLLQIVAPPPHHWAAVVSAVHCNIRTRDSWQNSNLLGFAVFLVVMDVELHVSRVPCPQVPIWRVPWRESWCLALVPNFYLIPAHAFGDIYIYYNV